MLPSRHGRHCIRYLGDDAPTQGKAFSSEQAEAITEVVRAGMTGGVATKADLAELRGDMAEIRNDLLWVKRIGGAIVAIIVAASGFAFNMLIEMSGKLAAMETSLAALASGG